MVVWAGASSSDFDTPAVGAAYDPGRREWNPVAPAPVRRSSTQAGLTHAFSTDTSLVVVGAQRVCPANADCSLSYFVSSAYAAEYRPSDNSWRELPAWPADRELDPPVRLVSGGWDGDRLVVLPISGFEAGRVWALDLSAGTWSSLPDRPQRMGQFPVGYPDHLLWVGTSQPFKLRRGETNATEIPVTSGQDVGGNASLAAVPVGATAVVLHGRDPHGGQSKVLDVDRGKWLPMPSPQRDFGMSYTGGQASWTGREILVLLERRGRPDSERAAFDVGVYTPGR
jgi:hypothetical protein